MTYKALADIQKDLSNKNLLLKDLVNTYLTNIENNKDLNAFLDVWNEEALERASEIQVKIDNNEAGKLAGLVIGIKDNIAYNKHHVSASSKILSGFESVYNATVVERLLAEDAIIIGRLNMDEFAMGSSNETSVHGVVKNPLDKTKVPGGSSGGSAAAVSANLCLAALGSDTGGSIRQPASFTGTYGFKPSYGVISRHGLLSYASSFDQIGPITQNVKDAKAIMDVISGKDSMDSTMYQNTENWFESATSDVEKPKKIGYFKQYLESEGLDPEIKSATLDALEKLTAQGHKVEAIDFPYLDYLIPTYYILTTAEASSNLSRYDGIHYGYRSLEAEDIESTYLKSRTEGFGPEVKRRIMLGTFVLSSGYYDAYYTKAQKVRRVIKDKTSEIFKDFDFIITPTTPITAFGIGENIDDPITMYLQDIFTVQSNLSGNTSIAMPYKKHSNGLPISIQIMADNYQDNKLLDFAEYVKEVIG